MIGPVVIHAAVFYLFAIIAVAAGAMVVTARNPVHSVLFLILAFFNAAGLFLLMGAEFLAFIMIIVYVGAVAVLFLFVVMMLDINFVELRQGFMTYLPIGAAIGIVLFFELALVLGTWIVAPEAAAQKAAPVVAGVSNTQALGRLLYTDYIYLFQASGIVLLIAMIGAIVLTLRRREGVRRQKISSQLARTREASIEVRKVQPGSGV
jgi:NADH-quinone oxidoreductase subunit J